ncbi:hypothetical protein SAMN05660350_01707 [Geodermatophilus obscurus]|uniref:Uncharacterized protein n=1 Tax=Geodermatophilus obscurus TaxID=1861 RepID=A0A1M7TGI3_9ACTN|nr:hypothetical protein SAMN05660350_01707 [Geodermatophilus obscurus]
MPAVDHRAAELKQLPGREQHRETRQPRGREDLCQDGPEHLTDHVADRRLRSRDDCACADLNGPNER